MILLMVLIVLIIRYMTSEFSITPKTLTIIVMLAFLELLIEFTIWAFYIYTHKFR